MAFLSECRQQAEGLEKCVASAFGPLGRDRFVRHAERPMELLITSSGETVIDAISETNPIVRVLRDAGKTLRHCAETQAPTVHRIGRAVYRVY